MLYFSQDVLEEFLKQEAIERYHGFLQELSGHMTSMVDEWGSGVEDEKDILLVHVYIC